MTQDDYDYLLEIIKRTFNYHTRLAYDKSIEVDDLLQEGLTILLTSKPKILSNLLEDKDNRYKQLQLIDAIREWLRNNTGTIRTLRH